MKIIVRSEGVNLSIPFPTGMIDSFVVRLALKEGLKKSNVEYDVDMIMNFLHAVKKELKNHKGLHLVEVEATDGTYVDIVV